MTFSRFFIKAFNFYNAETRLLFQLQRVDESGGFGLQADVVFDCPFEEVEQYIIHEYLEDKSQTPLTKAGVMFFPKVLIGNKYHFLKECLTWFMLIDEDEKFDILNGFLKARESEVVKFTNLLFGQRAKNVEYTLTIAA